MCSLCSFILHVFLSRCLCGKNFYTGPFCPHCKKQQINILMNNNCFYILYFNIFYDAVQSSFLVELAGVQWSFMFCKFQFKSFWDEQRNIITTRCSVSLTEPFLLQDELDDCEPSQTYAVINTSINDVRCIGMK